MIVTHMNKFCFRCFASVPESAVFNSCLQWHLCHKAHSSSSIWWTTR